MRYVFPDGEPLLLSRVQLAFERAHFTPSTSRASCATTPTRCAPGTTASTSTCHEAERLAGLERLRIWRLYLRAARHGFDVGYTAVYQIKARKPVRDLTPKTSRVRGGD